MGKHGISEEVLVSIKDRDRLCVFCHKPLHYPYERTRANDCATICLVEFGNGTNKYVTGRIPMGLVACCGACNSSKQDKDLTSWFKSKYCAEKRISKETVALPVKQFIKYKEEINLSNEQ